MSARRSIPAEHVIPVGRRRLYAFVVVLFPILLLALVEGVLRILLPAPQDDLFVNQTVNGVEYRSINQQVTKRYFPSLSVQPATSSDMFRAKKLPGTVRIFCLGESSTLGYPYMFNGSFPAMLRDRLRERYPDRTIEVVNLGVTAVTSHTVLDFGRRCLSEEPDVLVVYAGHNEYYGSLGIGSSEYVGSSRWIVRLYLDLHGVRLFLALKGLVQGLFERIADPAGLHRSGTLMELLAREKDIPYGSDTYWKGLEIFRENMVELLDAAGERDIPVVLSTLVSNVRDLPPLRSVFEETTPPSQRSAVESALPIVDSLIRSSQWREVGARLNKVKDLDTLHAGLAYATARWEAYQGNHGAAKRLYERARDLDGLRFRASSDVNALLRTLGRSAGVYEADAESTMSARSPNGSIGHEFLLEHVHANLAGYGVIADAVETQVVRALKDRGVAAVQASRSRPEPFVTDIDSIAAAFRIRILVNSWPFTAGSLTLDDLKANTWEEEQALAFLRKDLTWEELHVRMAERRESEGRWAESAREYRALIAATPFNVSPYLRLGSVLQRSGDRAGARSVFEASLAVERTSHAFLQLGEIAYSDHAYAVAAARLTDALQTGDIAPGRVPDIQLSLAVAFFRNGDVVRARTLAEGIVQQHPEFKPGREFLEYLTKNQRGGER